MKILQICLEIIKEEREIKDWREEEKREFELRRLEISNQMENSVRQDTSEANTIRVKQNPHSIMPWIDGFGDTSIFFHLMIHLFDKKMLHLNV